MTSENPVWHPYTQMQTHSSPLLIERGQDEFLFDKQGQRYVDAVASWWTNLHGHAHPHIAQKIAEQAQKLEHVIFAGFTHQPAQQLAAKLLQRIPYHNKIFYSDNGSTAVEVALKMALQYFENLGRGRRKIIAFKDAYHGDTFGAMSVSARGVFTQPFQRLLFDIEFIETPTPGNEQKSIGELNQLLEQNHQDIAAFIFEPLVLGSGGMLMYGGQVLDELISLCRNKGILIIADEVMTGFGRTGKFWATDYCHHKPDILCMSKGITGGFMPFAATSCKQFIYDAFLSDEKSKMFFHGHSYTGNPLGCAAGLASLEVFELENTLEKIKHIESSHAAFAQKINSHAAVKEIRQRGTIIALELRTGENTGYLNTVRDKAYQFFIDRKIILRPLGNVIYILPPYCICDESLQKVYAAIEEFLDN
jgi:adenosylmethionine---8-amino-7-oxononanoate aminotransferase